ncbi:MAG TPA: sigma-70 family RNA polymerase sigma factor [Vicinamibacterales bacterium]|nr:sigma-70 family RNA polymerase sigma factor [Vicinamibacterales bacterium]
MSDPGPRSVGDRPAEDPAWRLSRTAFDRFLVALDADRDAAAAAYERIRSRLVKFFSWRGCTFPEERADETITRVIRKIDEGLAVRDPATYCYGVARHVLLETLKQQERERDALSRFRPAPPSVDDDEDRERRIECLQRCLEQLAPDQRELILDYHRGDPGDRIDGRRRLAERLGIGLNALRIRVHRTTDRVEGCVGSCLRRRGDVK